MVDFLTFKSFISIEALIVFYYIGALILPIALWFVLIWLVRKYKLLNTAYKNSKEIIWNLLNTKQKIKLIALFLIAFLFMQLFWRMLFEFLIAYMQIRDALLLI